MKQYFFIYTLKNVNGERKETKQIDGNFQLKFFRNLISLVV